jgi:predicted HTH domain antitoxin
MSTLTVSLNFPHEILGTMSVPETRLAQRLYELIALELFREGIISAGKGGELVGISKAEFIQLLAKYNIPYFNQSPEELVAEVNLLEYLLSENTR